MSNRISKARIVGQILTELSGCGLQNPHARDLAKKWLTSRWNPAVQQHGWFYMEYKQWEKAGEEWTPVKESGLCILINYPGYTLAAWLDGREIRTPILSAMYQQRLKHLHPSQVNEAIGTPQLFDINKYKPSQRQSAETAYTHEDG